MKHNSFGQILQKCEILDSFSFQWWGFPILELNSKKHKSPRDLVNVHYNFTK
jgi:hypothetical protein